VDPTAEFAQLQLGFVDQIQWRYEVVRPLVLFGNRSEAFGGAHILADGKDRTEPNIGRATSSATSAQLTSPVSVITLSLNYRD